MTVTSQVAGKTEREVMTCVNCKVLCKGKSSLWQLKGDRRTGGSKNPPLDLFFRPTGVISQGGSLIGNGCPRRDSDLHIKATWCFQHT